MPSHYENNKDIYKARRVAQKARIRAYMIERKKAPCTDCGVQYPHYVMDWDHVGIKTTEPGQMANNGWGIERIEKELAECELVCSNCHRVRTHERRIGIV